MKDFSKIKEALNYKGNLIDLHKAGGLGILRDAILEIMEAIEELQDKKEKE